MDLSVLYVLQTRYTEYTIPSTIYLAVYQTKPDIDILGRTSTDEYKDLTCHFVIIVMIFKCCAVYHQTTSNWHVQL